MSMANAVEFMVEASQFCGIMQAAAHTLSEWLHSSGQKACCTPDVDSRAHWQGSPPTMRLAARLQ